MGVKQDTNGQRFVELATDVPGTPEAVWTAIATGPGISAWFVPTEVEERVGGKITFHLGAGLESTGTITAWEPPYRVAYEEHGWMGEAPPLATEFTVAAASGGACTVRIVHSLFTQADDWDTQLESMETGWPPFFLVLRRYLERFHGQQCVSLRLNGVSTASEEAAWHALKESLGFSGGTEGHPPAFRPVPGAPLQAIDSAEAVVMRERAMLAHLTEPAQGIFLACAGAWGEQVFVCIQLYFYGPHAPRAAASEEPQWQAWLDTHFPPGA